MSNPQLSSNAASALLATINESPNTQHNNYVYSETDAIVPQTSMQWENLSKSSGSSASSQSLHFDVNKNGYLTKMVLGLKFAIWNTESAGDWYVGVNYALNCISEITVSSGGRVILRHTRETLMAHISELPDYVKGGYVAGTAMSSVGKSITAAVTSKGTPSADQLFFLNIPGFWEKNKTSLNTSFLQPLRVTVRFADFEANTSVPLGKIDLVDSNSTLYVQYRNMQDPVDSSTIQSNYGDGLLSQLITTWSQENPTAVLSTGVTSVTLPAINLKETSCVESMYVMIIANNAQSDVAGANRNSFGRPLELENIEFKSNGNSYVDVPAAMLMYYGTQSTHGSKGFGSTNYTDTNSIETGGTKFVYKVDFGQGDTDRNELTNLLSFRELANPQLIIKWKPPITATDYNVHVVYKRSELSNTVSSNGKYAIALSN